MLRTKLPEGRHLTSQVHGLLPILDVLLLDTLYDNLHGHPTRTEERRHTAVALLPLDRGQINLATRRRRTHRNLHRHHFLLV